MGEALAFIHEFVTWLSSWFPHVGICTTTHGGVRWRRGKKVKVILPGLYIWIPICTEVKLIFVKLRPVDLPSQSVTTKDMESVTISVTLQAEIGDVEKACTECEDVDNMIIDVAQTAATPVIFKRTLKESLENYSDVLKEILEEARKLLQPYGVKVKKVGITDLTIAKVHRHFGDPTYTGDEED